MTTLNEGQAGAEANVRLEGLAPRSTVFNDLPPGLVEAVRTRLEAVAGNVRIEPANVPVSLIHACYSECRIYAPLAPLEVLELATSALTRFYCHYMFGGTDMAELTLDGYNFKGRTPLMKGALRMSLVDYLLAPYKEQAVAIIT